MTKFYFLRHGESTANAANRVSNPSVELTEKGKEQAKTAAKQLKDARVDTILVSPLIRARQTAEIIANELAIPEENIQTLDILNERALGEYDDQPRPEDKNHFYTIDEGVGLEKLAELTKRAEKAVAEVAKCTEGHTVLVVGHGIPGYFMRQLVAGKVPHENFDWSQKIKNAEVVEMIISK